jgi:signal transduction histidine kinase
VSRLTITRRLIALVTVPLVFTGGFAGWALTTTGREALSVSRLMGLVSVANEAGVLADRLQHERAAATAVLLGGSPFEQLVEYLDVADATDDAVDRYRRVRTELPVAPAGAQVLLDRIDDQLSRLTALRDDVREGPTVALSAVTFTYRITIADLVSLRETVAQAHGGSADLLGRIRAAGALSRATEYSARLQIEVLQSIASGDATTPADQQAIMATRAGYREAMASFAELAPPQWQDWLDHALTGSGVLTAQRLEDLVARAPAGTLLRVETPQWMAATREQISRLHQVEQQVDEAVRAEVEQVYGGKLGWVAAQAAVVVVALMVAVVMAIGQSRSMIRRLRGLSDSARATAFVSLPRTVEKLRAIGPQTIDPEAFANQVEAPVPDVGGDEIADVSKAFLSVHRQAMRTAAELANMRAGLSQILLHLARRNQRLVGGLIRELDGAERSEDDPDRLATLFRLDQLATRMGRYNDNLLVVGGQTASRVDAADVTLNTVLRGGQSKIEHYQRISFAAVDELLMVRGNAIHDLINLLAELLDNATQFSPPHTPVQVTTGVANGCVVIRVRDAGVGIPLWRIEPFNQTLASPPAIDVTAIRSMGLTVVAHIAARHGIGVRLIPGSPVGTLAEVSLPRTVCQRAGYPPLPPLEPLRAALPVGGPPARPSPQAEPARSTYPEPPIFRAVASQFSWFESVDPPLGRSRSLRNVADAGWAAAAFVAVPQTGRVTGSGLPRRPPMANLVPGSVPDGVTGVGAVDHRDPGLVAASVAAFAQGNAHSRALHTDRTAPTDYRVPTQRSARAADPRIRQEHR